MQIPPLRCGMEKKTCGWKRRAADGREEEI
jgi:hypothetical protein